jgi:hypothetical protein
VSSLNNTDEYWILQELDDHRILMKFSRDFDQNSGIGPQNQDVIRILQELDDHGILLEFCTTNKVVGL